MKTVRFQMLACIFSLLLAGCSQERVFVETPSGYANNLPDSNVSLKIASLSNCTDQGDGELRLNTKEPVTIIVHGCFSSAGRFRYLSEVFAFHGQQAICFNYDDRERLTTSADKLKTAIAELSTVLDDAKITVIGHSQGGLIARSALTTQRPEPLGEVALKVDLTTISSPFGGIDAASHCGSTRAAWLSLGIVKLACQVITGDKYKDIPPNSDFIQQPGNLISAVDRHLQIVTNETDSCRTWGENGECTEDDFVFSVDEQYQEAVDAQPQRMALQVKSGHVEIVGMHNQAPLQLVDILQQHGVLGDTPASAAKDFSNLLANLYQKP